MGPFGVCFMAMPQPFWITTVSRSWSSGPFAIAAWPELGCCVCSSWLIDMLICCIWKMMNYDGFNVRKLQLNQLNKPSTWSWFQCYPTNKNHAISGCHPWPSTWLHWQDTLDAAAPVVFFGPPALPVRSHGDVEREVLGDVEWWMM